MDCFLFFLACPILIKYILFVNTLFVTKYIVIHIYCSIIKNGNSWQWIQQRVGLSGITCYIDDAFLATKVNRLSLPNL